jgi:hypothetical protein
MLLNWVSKFENLAMTLRKIIFEGNKKSSLKLRDIFILGEKRSFEIGGMNMYTT